MALSPVPYPKIEDLTQNIFGSDDIFNPKVSAPTTNLFNKIEIPKELTVSPNASQAMSVMQDIDRQVAQAQQQSAQAAKQAEAMAQQYQADTDKAIQQTIQLQQQQDAERRRIEAEKKAAEKQLKKDLEASPTKLVQGDINAVLNDPQYKNAGDLEKKAIIANAAIAVADKLRKSGYSEEVIKTSTDSFKGALENNVNAYIKENNDWRGLGDIALSIGKSATQWWQKHVSKQAGDITESQQKLLNGETAGGWEFSEALDRNPNLRQFVVRDGMTDTFGDFKLRSDLTPQQISQFNAEMSKAYVVAQGELQHTERNIKAMEDMTSPSQIRLTKNMEYEKAVAKAKREATGQNGFWDRFSDTASIISKYPLTMAFDQSGNLVIGVAAATAATLAAPETGGASLAALAGMVASGTFGAEMTEADIVNSARQEIQNTPIEQLRKVNGWDNIVKMSGGNEQLARQRFATMKADDDTTKAYLLSFALNAVGGEFLAARALANVGNRLAGKTATSIIGNNVGRGAAILGASVATEGIDEGQTQLFTNYTLNTAFAGNDSLQRDVMDDVYENAAIGAVVGGIFGSVTTAVDTASSIKSDTKAYQQEMVKRSLTDIQPKVDKYVQAGEVNFGELKRTIGYDLDEFTNLSNKGFSNDPDQISRNTQAYFDTIIDHSNINARLTTREKKELDTWLSSEYGINTNPFRQAERTVDMTQLADATVEPTNANLVDVWRAIHNIDTDKIQDVQAAETMAKVFKSIDTTHPETTFNRLSRYIAVREQLVKDDPSLKDRGDLLASVDRFAQNSLDANYSRLQNGQTSQAQGTGGTNNTAANTGSTGTSPANGSTVTTTQQNAGQTSPNTAGTGNVNPQSTGNNSSQQTPATANQPSPATTASSSTGSNAQGQPKAQNVGGGANPTTTPNNANQTPTGTGTTGLAEQGTEPTGLVNATTESTANGGGVTGTSQTKRNTNGKRRAITSQAPELVTNVINYALGQLKQDGVPLSVINDLVDDINFLLNEYAAEPSYESLVNTLEQIAGALNDLNDKSGGMYEPVSTGQIESIAESIWNDNPRDSDTGVSEDSNQPTPSPTEAQPIASTEQPSAQGVSEPTVESEVTRELTPQEQKAAVAEALGILTGLFDGDAKQANDFLLRFLQGEDIVTLYKTGGIDAVLYRINEAISLAKRLIEVRKNPVISSSEVVKGPIQRTQSTADMSGGVKMDIRLLRPISESVGTVVARKDGERGVIMRDGKRLYFLGIDNDIREHIGDINSNATLSDKGYTVVNTTRSNKKAEQINQSINSSGVASDTIWNNLYSSLKPTPDTVITNEDIAKSLEVPQNNLLSELDSALELLSGFFNGDIEATLDYLESGVRNNKTLTRLMNEGDIEGAVNYLLTIATKLETKEVKNNGRKATGSSAIQSVTKERAGQVNVDSGTTKTQTAISETKTPNKQKSLRANSKKSNQAKPKKPTGTSATNRVASTTKDEVVTKIVTPIVEKNTVEPVVTPATKPEPITPASQHTGTTQENTNVPSTEVPTTPSEQPATSGTTNQAGERSVNDVPSTNETPRGSGESNQGQNQQQQDTKQQASTNRTEEVSSDKVVLFRKDIDEDKLFSTRRIYTISYHKDTDSYSSQYFISTFGDTDYNSEYKSYSRLQDAKAFLIKNLYRDDRHLVHEIRDINHTPPKIKTLSANDIEFAIKAVDYEYYTYFDDENGVRYNIGSNTIGQHVVADRDFNVVFAGNKARVANYLVRMGIVQDTSGMTARRYANTILKQGDIDMLMSNRSSRKRYEEIADYMASNGISPITLKRETTKETVPVETTPVESTPVESTPAEETAPVEKTTTEQTRLSEDQIPTGTKSLTAIWNRRGGLSTAEKATLLELGNAKEVFSLLAKDTTDLTAEQNNALDKLASLIDPTFSPTSRKVEQSNVAEQTDPYEQLAQEKWNEVNSIQVYLTDKKRELTEAYNQGKLNDIKSSELDAIARENNALPSNAKDFIMQFTGDGVTLEQALELATASIKDAQRKQATYDLIKSATERKKASAEPVAQEKPVKKTKVTSKKEPAPTSSNEVTAEEEVALNDVLDTMVSNELAVSTDNAKEVLISDFQINRDKTLNNALNLSERTKDASGKLDTAKKDAFKKLILSALKKLANQLKAIVVAVSLAAAAYTGSTITVPNNAYAQTVTASSPISVNAQRTVNLITGTADNLGRPFLIADKKSGEIYLFDANGKLLDKAPALFGKTAGDEVGMNTSGAGRFKSTYVQNVAYNNSYGGSVQVLQNFGDNNAYAIHRVYTADKSENRPARLASKTASDNRISHGCINVPSEFFDKNLNQAFDGVVYVLNEDGSPPIANKSTPDVATTEAKATVTPTVAPAELKPVTTEPTVSPKPSQQPVTIAGTKPSEQVALVEPTTAKGMAVTQVKVPQGQHTPAETQVNAKFDTLPVMEKSEEGFSIYDIVASIAAMLGVGAVGRRISSKLKKGGTNATSTNNQTISTNAPANTASTTAPTTANANGATVGATRATTPTGPTFTPVSFSATSPVTPAIQQAIVAQATQQNNSIAPLQETAAATWLEYLANTQGNDIEEFLNMAGYLQSGMDAAMSDMSVAESRKVYEDYWKWKGIKKAELNADGTLKKNYSPYALFSWYSRHAGGITPGFDNLMNLTMGADGKPYVPRVGMAQDASRPSVNFAKIRASQQAIYGTVHKKFIKPVVDSINVMHRKYDKKTAKAKEGEVGYDIARDFGMWATLRHLLNDNGQEGEAVLNFFGGSEKYIQALRQDAVKSVSAIADALIAKNNITNAADKAKVYADVASLNEDKLLALAKSLDTGTSTKIQKLAIDSSKKFKEANRKEKLLKKQSDAFYGVTKWNGKDDVALPGGMTLKQMQDLRTSLLNTYEQADLDATGKMISDGIRGMRRLATAHGVFSNSDVQTWNEIGFERYVPLFKTKDKTNETDNELSADGFIQNLQETAYEGLFESVASDEVYSIGLTKDLTKFRRSGSHEPVDDAYTNMAVFARNIAGRAAQADFRADIQGLFEGTVRQGTINSTLTPAEVGAFEHSGVMQTGVMPGLVRIRADFPSRFIPSSLQGVQPIVARGNFLDKNGEVQETTFNYYFTDKVIQNEITHTIELNKKAQSGVFMGNTRTIMRWQSRGMTVARPAWSLWNFVKDSMERTVTIMARPVKDVNGNRVSRLKLITAYAKAIAKLSIDFSAQTAISRYIMHGETTTPLQRLLRDMHNSGAINIYTDTTEKFNMLGNEDKTFLERGMDKTVRGVKRLASKTKTTASLLENVGNLAHWYTARLAETPQVMAALAMGMAYNEVGVNSSERNNRVRDSFDPTRTQSNFVRNAMSFFPFVRSAGAGNYNTMRSIGDLLREPSGAMAVGVMLMGGVAVLAAASAAFGDDDDGNDKLAQMDTLSLQRGIPIPLPNGSVFYLPVGFGLPSIIYAGSIAIYKSIFGTYSLEDGAKDAITQLTKNTLPTQLPSGDGNADNAIGAFALMLTPTPILPFIEVAMNQRAFGGSAIVSTQTPQGGKDSEQDDFATPEAYKDLAKVLGSVGLDFRPENLRHVLNAEFGIGPLRAVDAYLQDKGEKTAGVQMNKGERIGPLLVALGADIGVDTNALSAENESYRLLDKKRSIMAKYNVAEKGTATPTDDVPDLETEGIDENADGFTKNIDRIQNELQMNGASKDEIRFVVESEKFYNAKKKASKDLRQTGLIYYKDKRSGENKAGIAESTVFEKATKVENLMQKYVTDNNQYLWSLDK